MINWLVKILGGRTAEEFKLLEVTLENWRQRAIAAETSLALFNEILTRERERSQRLEERLFPENKPTGPNKPSTLDPVGHSVSSWPRIKRELERLERQKDNAQVSREKIESEIRSEV